MADVRWIKIVTDVFDDEKILLIETMPEADSIIVIWFKLLCLAGKQNNSGVFTLHGRIPYTDEMFATIFRRPLNTVRLALKLFEQYRMIEIINSTVTIPNWAKHQSIDRIEARNKYMREYMANYRENQRKIASGINPETDNSKHNSKDNGKDNGKANSKLIVNPLEKRREEEIREDEEEDVRGDGNVDLDLPFGITEDEIQANKEAMNRVEIASSELGLPWNSADEHRANGMVADYTAEWVLAAIDRTGYREKRTWGTVAGILRSWKKKGGIDDPEPKSSVEDTANDMEWAYNRRPK